MEESGISYEKKTTSSLQCQVLDGEDVKRAMRMFRDIVCSCYGPNAKLKMLQNACGGHVTVTSSSSRLLPMLSINNPILKLLSVAVQGHLNTYKDGGLFACCLATTLLEQSLKSGIHKKLLADVYEYLLRESISYLKSDVCVCRVQIDFTNLASLRSIIRSVLSTKAACTLHTTHIRHLTSLVVESFLRSYTVTGEDKCCFAPVSFVCIEGRAPTASHLVNGVLFELGSLPGGRDNVSVKTSADPHMQGMTKVAVVTVSMSGDTADYVDVTYEITDDRVDVDDATVTAMYALCDRIIDDGAGLLLCQKVIHPRVSRYLHKRGVVAVQRLGATHAKLMQQLSGAVGINSVHATRCEYGWLDSVTEHKLENKSYIHLQREGAGVCSMILYHRTEESLLEVKTACDTALSTLRLSLQDAYVLTGAGCWQVHLAAVIKHQVKKKKVPTATLR